MLVVHLGDDDLGRAGARGRGCGAGAAVVDDSCDPLEEGLLVFESLLDGNLVLARHQTARIGASRDVAEPYVLQQSAEERNSLSDEHGNARDDQTLNKPGAQESLNGDAPVDVEMVRPTRGELSNDLGGCSGHLFNDAAARCGHVDRSTTQDHDAFLTIGPRVKRQHFLEAVAT
jgi:hypothetical protein